MTGISPGGIGHGGNTFQADSAGAACPRPPVRDDTPAVRQRVAATWHMRLRVVVAALVTMLAGAPASAADSFEERCARLVDPAHIVVLYQDQGPERDDTLDIQALEGLAARRGDRSARVLGLTQAEVSTQIQISARTLTAPAGRVCAAPHVRVTLGYEAFRVYVARDAGNACRRGVVETHEREHVSIWRNYLRAGAQLLASQIRQDLAQPLVYESMTLADRNVTRHVQTIVAGHVRKLVENIGEANRQLDTPAAYQTEAGRLQACG